jgi:hypothetical protein
MKLTKVASLAAVATLALGAYSAKASYTNVGTTTDYMKVNLSVIVQTNKPDLVISNNTAAGVKVTSKWSAGKLKLNNKALLEIFADGWSTNGTLAEWQAAKAQLIYDGDSEQICVAYKDGMNMNILFYAGDGFDDGTNEAYFDLTWNLFSSGIYTGHQTYTSNYTATGYTETWNWSETDFQNGLMVIHYDTTDDYVLLVGLGADTEKEKGSETGTYNSNEGTYTDEGKWSGSESFKPSGLGSLHDYTAVFRGSISAKGNGTWKYIYK